MSLTKRCFRASVAMSVAGVFCLSAAHAESQSQKAIDDAMSVVDQVLDRKDLNNIPDYKDDRSTPETLIASYYNAINRGEFSRAYSYFPQGDFASWVRGYENTRGIRLIIGSSEGDPGAGRLYWHQPVSIEAESYEGRKEVYAGCYEISMSAPLNQETPPFQPMSITSGSLSRSTKSLNESLPKSCMPD